MKSNDQILLKIFFLVDWVMDTKFTVILKLAFIDILLDLHIHVPPFMMM